MPNSQFAKKSSSKIGMECPRTPFGTSKLEHLMSGRSEPLEQIFEPLEQRVTGKIPAEIMFFFNMIW